MSRRGLQRTWEGGLNDIPLIGGLLDKIVDNGTATDAVNTGNKGDFAGQGPDAIDVAHGNGESVGYEGHQNFRRVYLDLYNPLAPLTTLELANELSYRDCCNIFHSIRWSPVQVP